MSFERAREREVFKYYQTWLDSSVGFKLAAERAPSGRLHTDGTGLRSSNDTALIAFAQLGCLRLNVMRGLVTLIARSQQYVLAEATRTLSLVSDTQHAAKDGLWFGNSSLPRSQGVSENALDPAPYTAFGPNGESYTAPAFVVNDLAQDERFMDRGYAGRGISFYAGVPISTVSGFAIGVYTVTDDRPRSGLSAEELQFMQDMASTVGNHLDKIGNESARYRGERMVLGLGSFIEGKSTTYGESMDGDQPAYLSVADSLPRQTPEGENRYQQFKGMTITNANPSALRRAWTSEDVDQVVHSSHDPTDGTVDGKSSPPPGDQPTLIEQQNSNEQAHHDRRGQSSLFQPRSSNDAPAPMQPKDLRHTFWRAANIMRECTAADGVIFYNAMNTNEAKGHIRSNSSHFDVPPAQQSEASTPGSSDDLTLAYEVPISRSASSDSIKQASRTASQGRDTKSMNCEKLGFSLSVAADSKASKMSTASLDISEHTLRRFLRRYPRGKLFSYAEDGEVSTSEGDRRHSRSREKDLHQASGLAHPMIRPKTLGKVFAEELLKVIPGARNVIFLPLWDSHKQKWAAGTFVWSRRPGQLLQAQDDLSYLKAFGNSIMSEVARLDAVTADKAKTSFIANISHELRSPLHGILGSIEFLHDTAVDDFQSSLITSIETCGRTLLDTLNNVLTYAKINHLSRRGSGRYAELEAKGNDSGLQNSLANVLETDFDLATVVEEVVEAVYAGQTFRPTGILHDIDESKNPLVEATTPSEDTSATSGSIQRRSTKSYGLVRITLDIEHLSDWRVHSQPGAVRRLVMNILGNALKYTEKGKIQVSLESRQQRSDKPSSLAVCLSITDTGKGMSANFVKNHAFTPFIQEDSFASGTGLGLSIVRQIVNTLGGTVDLQSEQGTGTDVKIWLTLLRANSPQAPEFSGGLLPTVMKQTPGLKICILDPKFAKQDPSTHTPEHDIKDPIERSIRNMAQEWFQMDVLTSSQMNGVAADFFIYAEPPPIEDLLERHGCPSMSEEVPIIIVATSANETASLRASCINHLTESGRIVEVISQPCGPQKLAKAIHRCLHRLQEDPEGAAACASVQTQIRDYPDESSCPAVIENALPQAHEPAQKSEAHNTQPSSKDNSEHPEAPQHTSSNTIPTDHQVILKPSLPSRDNKYNNSSVNTSEFEVPAAASDKSPILLVDDNEINLKLLVTFMKKAKFSYECATDGLQALQAYKRASADRDRAFRYILMDISMPVMDGLAATREIREFERKNKIEPRTVIIALTGLASEMTQNDALHSGMDYFRVKPVKFKDLLKVLACHIPEFAILLYYFVLNGCDRSD